MPNKNVRIIIASNRTTIPNIKEMIAKRIQQVGGEQKMAHALIRQQIISERISHEKYGIPKNMDYYEKLSKLRQELQKTR